MRRLGRYIERGFVGLIILLVILVAGVAILSHTHRAREWVRLRAVTYLNNSYRGRFSIGRIDGSLLWNIRLHNLEVSNRGAEILHISTIAVSYSILDLIVEKEISSVNIDHAMGHLARDSDREWNLLAALSAKHPHPPSKASNKSRLTIKDLVVKDSSIEVVQAGKCYRIEPAFIGLYFNLDGSAIDARIRRIALRVAVPGIPNLAVNGSLAYRAEGRAPARLGIPELRLSTAASRITLVGAIDNLDTLQGHATISAYLGAGDIRKYVARWAPRQNLWGTIRVRGQKHDLRGNAELFAAGGKIDSQVEANLVEKSPTVRASVSISGFDMSKAIQGAALRGVVDANVKAYIAGTSLSAIKAEGSLNIHDARMGAMQTRLIAMRAQIARNVVSVTGELTGGAGDAKWDGQIDLGRAQTYHLTLTLNHLNVRRIAANKRRIDSNLNMRAQLSGSGFELGKAKARADVAVLPSSVGQVRIEDGRIKAGIGDRRVRINMALNATAAHLKANGDAALTASPRVKIEYELHLADLAPWFGMIGQQGSGSLNLAGRVSGSVDSLRTQNQVRFTALTYGTNYAGCGEASINMNKVGKPRMHGRVTVSMNQIRSGLKFKTINLTAFLAQLRPVTVVGLSVRTEDEHSLKDRIDGEIRRSPTRTEITLALVSIQDSEAIWTNPSPARIVADGKGLTIDKFLLMSGQSRIFLEGRASKTGRQNVRLQLDGLKLRAIKAVLQSNVDLGGLLSIQGSIDGTAASPVIHLESSISGLSVSGQHYQNLSATIAYENKRANLDLIFHQDRIHTLTAKGVLPVALRWDRGFQMKSRGDIALHAVSAGLSLTALNALDSDAVRQVKGMLLLDLAVKGPVAQPVASGFVKVHNGAAMVVPTGIRLENIELTADLTPRLVRIAQAHVTSGAGTIDANGQISLENYKPGNIKMAIHMVKWPAIRNQQYRATANGQIDIAGTVSAPAVTGKVEIIKALVRPDIAFLTSEPPPPDPTIHLVSTAPAPQPKHVSAKSLCPPPQNIVSPPGIAKPAAKSVNAEHGLSLDIKVRLRRDIWVKQENGSAELTGEVQVTKTGSKPLRLVGEIETVRGWLTVVGKQFKIASAKVIFTGSAPIDPSLDITADYQARQYLVHVIVGGTASKPTLGFKSEPDLEQTDILSVLLFGKPSSQLSGGQRTDLQTQASEVAEGFAVSQISQQVSKALGLQEMGIEVRQIGSGVGIASYLGQSTYATVSQDLGQQGGQRVDLEHYLTPHLKIDTDTTAQGDRGADILWSTSY